MKNLYKIASIALISLSVFPLFAAAQASYSSNPYYYPSNYSNQSGACTALTAYLRLGSSDAYTDGQVSVLQQFLNRTGYLNGVSGYFDSGTYGAVLNYQRTHGVPATGTVGPLTRASINQQECNSGSYPYQNQHLYQNQYPYSYSAPPTISSLSASSGSGGMSVTVYGSNFANNAIVHFDGTTVATSYATNGALTFTVPYASLGTYQLYVSNAYGSSNSMTFSVIGNTNGNCGFYTTSYQCGCAFYNNYPYNNCSNTISSGTWFGGGSQPSISGVSGQGTVPSGAMQTWSVVAYSQSNLPFTVSVDWGDGTSQQSTQGYGGAQQSYSFSHAYGSYGTYTIRFTATDTTGAYAYSTLPVSVYGSSYNNNSYPYGTPYLSSLSSTAAPRGSTITLFGSNFSSNVTVNLSGPYGNYTYTNTNSYNNGTQTSFTIPYITPGAYSLSVMNSSGQGSNTMSLTIY